MLHTLFRKSLKSGCRHFVRERIFLKSGCTHVGRRHFLKSGCGRCFVARFDTKTELWEIGQNACPRTHMEERQCSTWTRPLEPEPLGLSQLVARARACC